MELKEGAVKLQFLAGIDARQGRVEELVTCDDNGIRVASLRDLLATKLNTIQMRAEAKDYIDIDAMLAHGLTLDDGLGCAQVVYGASFDPGTSLRALCSFRDGDLVQLPEALQKRLIKAATSVDKIPTVNAISATI